MGTIGADAVNIRRVSTLSILSKRRSRSNSQKRRSEKSNPPDWSDIDIFSTGEVQEVAESGRLACGRAELRALKKAV